jgi:cell division protein FtsB
VLHYFNSEFTKKNNRITYKTDKNANIFITLSVLFISIYFNFQFIFQKNALTTIIQVQVTKTKRKPHNELRPTPALEAGPFKACQS